MFARRTRGNNYLEPLTGLIVNGQTSAPLPNIPSDDAADVFGGTPENCALAFDHNRTLNEYRVLVQVCEQFIVAQIFVLEAKIFVQWL